MPQTQKQPMRSEMGALPRVQGAQRVIIENVEPHIDCGLFPIKRTPGEEVQVSADIFADGHDVISAVLKVRFALEQTWSEMAMTPEVNDRWRGSFRVRHIGQYFYTIEAWINHFRSWRRDLKQKYEVDQDISMELQAGISFLQAAAGRAVDPDKTELLSVIDQLARSQDLPVAERFAVAVNPRLADLLDRLLPREHSAVFKQELPVIVDSRLARFGAWYEMFPRSCSVTPGAHGTFKDCVRLLPRIARMGFDVLYLPPIHPIGSAYRKGSNNSLQPGPDDPGSPWAIGSAEGGHKSVHPQLGTLQDFRELVQVARSHELEIALDIAFQCSPDHPYVKEHPQWFKHRPDGSVQYAENPPKKYQDIYPLNFETEDWRSLWWELKSIFEFWMSEGVRVFRVDNPHTKSFRFWEWCIGELKAARPDLIFLSEAFTRPKVMAYLAKIGFTQSYNYFPWRNSASEIREYFTELTRTELREFLRSNLWLNTPDILPEYLQFGGRPAFVIRLVLAATLGASYGIYGPPFEFCENAPREPGTEEYLNSEKYEIRHWDFDRADGLRDLITRVNEIRHAHPALQSDENLVFHAVDNPELLAYSKQSPGHEDIILTVVNLDPHHTQRGWVNLDFHPLGFESTAKFQVHELLTDSRYLWHHSRNYVELNPAFVPAHIFQLRRFVRTEQNFDYFL